MFTAIWRVAFCPGQEWQPSLVVLHYSEKPQRCSQSDPLSLPRQMDSELPKLANARKLPRRAIASRWVCRRRATACGDPAMLASRLRVSCQKIDRELDAI